MTTIFKNIIENEPAIIPYMSHKVAPTRLTDLSFNMSLIKNDPMIKNDLVIWKLNEWVDSNVCK